MQPHWGRADGDSSRTRPWNRGRAWPRSCGRSRTSCRACACRCGVRGTRHTPGARRAPYVARPDGMTRTRAALSSVRAVRPGDSSCSQCDRGSRPPAMPLACGSSRTTALVHSARARPWCDSSRTPRGRSLLWCASWLRDTSRTAHLTVPARCHAARDNRDTSRSRDAACRGSSRTVRRPRPSPGRVAGDSPRNRRRRASPPSVQDVRRARDGTYDTTLACRRHAAHGSSCTRCALPRRGRAWPCDTSCTRSQRPS